MRFGPGSEDRAGQNFDDTTINAREGRYQRPRDFRFGVRRVDANRNQEQAGNTASNTYDERTLAYRDRQERYEEPNRTGRGIDFRYDERQSNRSAEREQVRYNAQEDARSDVTDFPGRIRRTTNLGLAEDDPRPYVGSRSPADSTTRRHGRPAREAAYEERFDVESGGSGSTDMVGSSPSYESKAIRSKSFRAYESEPLSRSPVHRRREDRVSGTTEYKNRKAAQKRVISKRSDDDDDSMLDDDTFAAKRAARKNKRELAKQRRKESGATTPIFLPEFISVSNLAIVLKIRVEHFLDKMKELGFGELSNDHIMDAETAGLIAAEFNFEAVTNTGETEDIKPQAPAEDKAQLAPRPPVVTIMGHVDHGKTTMLDFLRKSSVAASEHGGITQHIGAFSVPMSGGRLVTFLDTPGHEAFLSMRQRGATVTDIVILVVAADDSVKPQTIEAISHAKTAKVPMIVAINKIDKDEGNIEQVKQDLSRHEVDIEDFGGDTQVVCVSGKTGKGMNELEEAIVALADIQDARADPNAEVEGWVLEAATSKQEGRVATILVRQGTLRPGDVIVAGTSWARVRSLRNEAGVQVDSAGPGVPVEIDGWREEPTAGDEVLQTSDEQKARSVVEYRLENTQLHELAKDVEAVNESRRQWQQRRDLINKAKEEAKAEGKNTRRMDFDSVVPRTEDSTINEVFFILKADVSGSVEAVSDAVAALGNNDIRANVLRSGIGSISEFDVEHAAAAKGHIINFNLRYEPAMASLAEQKGVKILDQSIIYRLVDEVRGILQDQLPPVITQRVLGEAEIAQVFDINVKGRKTHAIAGCRVHNGVVSRKAQARVLRGSETIFDGE